MLVGLDQGIERFRLDEPLLACSCQSARAAPQFTASGTEAAETSRGG